MKSFHERTIQSLLHKELLSKEQFDEIDNYRKLDIFSLNGELKIALYLSVLLFTSGIGMLVYQNIDTIGHTILIGVILLVALLCYYLSFKKSSGFQKHQTQFENPVYDYLVLTASILSCIFIGYLQFQYNAFGTHYGLATLIPTTIGFFTAYYFDNKNVLSLAITGLTAYIGLTVSPQSLLNNDFYDSTSLSYSAIGLGLLFILWSYFSSTSNFKKHFVFIFLTFALHLIGISCINNLMDSYWFLFIILWIPISYYFYNNSHFLKSVSLFAFNLIYSFIALNISLYKILELINAHFYSDILILLGPLYFIGTILLFINAIKKFNTQIKDDSTR